MAKKTEESHIKPVFTADNTPEKVIKELLSTGYDSASALSYAKAERSWSTKESPEWKLWIAVIEQLEAKVVSK
jgi:hypothetical protein